MIIIHAGKEYGLRDLLKHFDGARIHTLLDSADLPQDIWDLACRKYPELAQFAIENTLTEEEFRRIDKEPEGTRKRREGSRGWFQED